MKKVFRLFTFGTSNVALLLCAFSLSYSPQSFAVWAKTSGTRLLDFRCTNPIPLQNAESNIRDGAFENSIDWQALSSSVTPAPVALRIGIGRGTDFHLWAVLADLKSMGREWRVGLESRSIHPNLVAVVKHFDKKAVRGIENGASENFYNFQHLGKRKNTVGTPVLDDAWTGLLKNAFVLSRRTMDYDQEYAVIVSNSFSSIAICAKLPADELEYEDFPANVERDLLAKADKVALKFSPQELQDIAFRFSHDLNHVLSAKCEGSLSRGN